MAKLLRFPPELEARLTALAGRERRTFTAQVVLMLEQWFEEQERRGAYPRVAEDAGPPYRPHGESDPPRPGGA